MKIRILNKDLIIIIKQVSDKIFINPYKIVINTIIIIIKTKKRNRLVIFINHNNLIIQNHLI